MYTPHKNRSFLAFKTSFEIFHHRNYFDFLTLEVNFSNLVLVSRVIPPDLRHARLVRGFAVSETKDLKPGASIFALHQVSVRKMKFILLIWSIGLNMD